MAKKRRTYPVYSFPYETRRRWGARRRDVGLGGVTVHGGTLKNAKKSAMRSKKPKGSRFDKTFFVDKSFFKTEKRNLKTLRKIKKRRRR